MAKENSKDLNFEEAIKELETIATKLESGDASLEESIKLFEEGMGLSKKCTDFLDNAEKRITVLIENNGEVKEEDFKPEE